MSSGASTPKPKRIIIKVGSQMIRFWGEAGLHKFAGEVAKVSEEVGIVSSGAIALGLEALRIKERPQKIAELQMAAAVGQTALFSRWQTAFHDEERMVGQVLLTHDDISARKRFLAARHTMRAMFERRVIPVINENDAVSVEEIKYGDNDLLAAMVCNLCSADALILLTNVDGLLKDGQVVPLIADLSQAEKWVSEKKSPLGSGGMRSKLDAARIAGQQGVDVLIANGATFSLKKFLGGTYEGTWIPAPAKSLPSRKHWIAYGKRPEGQVHIDDGAWKAIGETGASLLSVGIKEVAGEFSAGALVSVQWNGSEVGRGLIQVGSKEFRQGSVGEVIHRDDFVIFSKDEL